MSCTLDMSQEKSQLIFERLAIAAITATPKYVTKCYAACIILWFVKNVTSVFIAWHVSVGRLYCYKAV